MADLQPERAPASTPKSVSIESLAASKGLPVTALTRYGVRTVKTMSAAERLQHGIGGSDGVWIPYFNPDGTVTGRTRLRTAHVAKDGSRWLGSFGAIMPYGLHDLADAKENGIVCICEGESDYWSLRECGVPALALPGSQMIKSLQRSHLLGVMKIYVCQDSDAAGAAFVANVRQHVAAWGIVAYALQMPDGCKDVNDLYRRDPKGCEARIIEMMTRAETLSAPPAREFSTEGDIYTLTVPEWSLRLELDQIRRSFGECVGELAVISEFAGDMSRATVNLSSLEKRQTHASALSKRTGLPEIDWPALIEEFAIKTLKAEREGQPSILLSDVARPAPEETINIDGIVLPRRHPSCLFGDGGTGKSYIALYIAGVLTRQGMRCAYIDAELNADEHRLRLGQLFGDGLLPPVAYMRLDRALVYSVDQVRRMVRDREIDYIVLDSVGVLTAGPPEAAEHANGYIRALRQIGVGSLSVAHVTKAAEGNDKKPFGSVFYHNGFRCTWYAAQADPENERPDDNRLIVGLWNRKANLAKRARPTGLELEFNSGYGGVQESVVVSRVDPATIEGLAAKVPVRRQIEVLLRGGPQTRADIIEELGLPEATVKTALARGKKDGYFVLLQDATPARWALATRD